MSKIRLDQYLFQTGQVSTRSQAASYIKLGKVEVDSRVVSKSGFLVSDDSHIKINVAEQYVSRAALKLASVTERLKIDFKNKVVLDVGSSTGGFSDYALRRGALKVIAVERGRDQLHPSLRTNSLIELHEHTDIRDFKLSSGIDLVVIDVSFISLRQVLPHLHKYLSPDTQILAMVKPQFEASADSMKHKGVIKNKTLRRQILKDFETWAAQYFKVVDKADSEVGGAKGNIERFYLLKKA